MSQNYATLRHENPNPGPGRRFGPGNPGRPKGSRNKLGEHFFKTLHDDFLQHGEEVIERVRKDDPSTYLKVVSGLMPKELEVKRPVEEMSDDELAHLLDVARSLVGSELGVAGRDGEASIAEPARNLLPL